ncbi:MAG TPA: hypothetical protein VF183_07295 [Acidimicrobiales bacterium]
MARLWVITHRAGDPAASDHCVVEHLEDAIDEIRRTWPAPVAIELAGQIARKSVEASAARDAGQPTPQVIARMIVPDDVYTTSGGHAVVELQAYDTDDREWFGTLTRFDADLTPIPR